MTTSLQARYADLPVSPAGLLSHFAPSGFALASHSFCSRTFCALRSRKFLKKKCVSIDSKCSETRKKCKKKNYPFDPLRALRIKFTKIIKKSVSQSTRNALKRIEMPKKKIIPLWSIAQSPSGEAQSYQPHVTAGSQGVSMPSFMLIGLKLWPLEGYTQTNRQTKRQTELFW